MMRTFYISFAIIALFVGCSHINEDERLIEVEMPVMPANDDTTKVFRNILIEDFTGQRCVNCPKGAQVIEQLQESEYGNCIIAVGIYSGPFGKNVSGNLLPLTTQTGCDYYDYWKVESQPGAIINRSSSIYYSVNEWTAEVMKVLGSQSTIKMELEAQLNGNDIDITISEEGIDSYNGKLQVWVVEDSIVAVQTIPNAPDENPEWVGGNKRDYVHNHVFRTNVNNVWGDDLTITNNEKKSQKLTQAIDDTWNTKQLSIVAILYNVNGVEQVIKGKVKE